MPKRTWKGSAQPIEHLTVGIGTGVIRKVPRPAHPYGSPAADLKREEAEAAALAAAEEARKAAEGSEDA